MTSITSTQSEDSDLWAQVIAGSAAAFEMIVAKYQNAVSAVSYSRVGDFNISEDISQETFLIAWQSRSSLEEPEQLRGWLCGIARDYAVGGAAIAREANTPKAKAYLDQQWVTHGLKWMSRWAWLSYLAFPLGLLPVFSMKMFYRKQDSEVLS